MKISGDIVYLPLAARRSAAPMISVETPVMAT
jgi:hypothetical protein